MEICDLHVHSYFSDGVYSPEEILKYAVSIGIKAISLTDHDNARGIRELISKKTNYDIELIPGIEFTCKWEREFYRSGTIDIDVLGYNIDIFNPSFMEVENKYLDDIFERIKNCILVMQKDGLHIEYEDLLKHNKFYTGAHQLINALIYNGNFIEFKDAAEYLGQMWKKTRKSNFSIKETIEAIAKFGGIAVLAHPYYRDDDGNLITIEGFQELKDYGLTGIEIFHPSLDEESRKYLLKVANRLNLVTTGGSDEHGLPDGFHKMGKEPIPYRLASFMPHFL